MFKQKSLLSYKLPLLYCFFKQLGRSYILLYWSILTILLTVGCKFIASTLASEQYLAAIAYTSFILHLNIIISSFVLAIQYLARLLHSQEILFWVTLPYARANILSQVIIGFNSLIISMIIFCILVLKVFLKANNTMIIAFALAIGQESIVCITTLCCLAMATGDNLAKVGLLVIVVDIIGHISVPLERSLQSFLWNKDTKLDLVDITLNFLKLMLSIFPQFSDDFPIILIKNAGFLLTVGGGCHVALRCRRF